MATVLTQFLDRCIWTPASGGTGSFVLSAAVAGFQTMAAAGAVNGAVYGYAAQSSDLSQWEVGYGTWTAGTSTLTRTVTFNSLGTAVAVNFTSPPQVMITAIAETLVGFDAGFSYAGSGALTLALGTITANANALTITGTWNNAAVTFDAPLFMNITNTASAAASKLIDIQVGGSSLLNVQTTAAAGQLNLPVAGGYNNLSISLSTGGSGIYGNSSGQETIGFRVGSALPLVLTTANLRIDGRSQLTWDNNGGGTYDIQLGRDAAANILAQYNSTNAQTFRVYNTTDGSGGIAPTNYERGVFDWTTTANVLTIGTQKGGTGTARAMTINSADLLNITTGNDIIINVFGSSVGRFRNSEWRVDVNVLTLSNTDDAGITRTAAGVIGLTNAANAATSAGWLNWGGEARVTSDFSVTSSTALTNVTGLTVNVAAGRTYAFEVYLQVTDAAAGGVQAAIAGTATATAIQYTGWTVADNAIKGKTNATALATAVGSTTTTETSGIIVQIVGTITVNVAGTLTVQMAQNTSNGTATIVKRGSYMIVQDMP